MKPETKDYVAAAHRHGRCALRNLSSEAAPVAAREADMAAFHAAQALIFERAGKPAKTHNGTQSQFHQLERGETGFPAPSRVFLSSGFSLKSSADWSATELPTVEQARRSNRRAPS